MKLIVMRHGNVYEVHLKLKSYGLRNSIVCYFKEIDDIGVYIKTKEIMIFDGDALYETGLYVDCVSTGMLSNVYTDTGSLFLEPEQDKFPETYLVSDGKQVSRVRMFSYKKHRFVSLGGHTSDDYPIVKEYAGCVFLYSLQHGAIPMVYFVDANGLEYNKVLIANGPEFRHMKCITKVEPKQPVEIIREGDIVFAPSLSNHQHTVEVDKDWNLYISVNGKSIYFDENGRLRDQTHKTIFPAHLKSELELLMGVELHYNKEETEKVLMGHLEKIINYSAEQVKENANFENKIQESIEVIKQLVLN